MFGKLLKYEFRANGKVLLPLYGLALASTALMRLFTWLAGLFWPRVGAILNGVCQSLVVIMLIGVALFGFGYVVVRFYRSMVGREAYLTLTLPVKNTSHFWSKLLSGLCFSVAGLLVAYGMLYIYGPVSANLSGSLDIGQSSIGLNMLLGSLNFSFMQKVSAIGLILAFIVIDCAYMLNEFFFCCAVGSQFKSKPLAAVITYFITHNALGLVSILCVILPIGAIVNANGDKLEAFIQNLQLTLATNYSAGINTILGYLWLLLLAFAALLSLVFIGQFLVSRHLLTKKVNLE